jgi:hypothetical protein
LHGWAVASNLVNIMNSKELAIELAILEAKRFKIDAYKLTKL